MTGPVHPPFLNRCRTGCPATVAEIDTNERIVRYVNCGHNPAPVFQAITHAPEFVLSTLRIMSKGNL